MADGRHHRWGRVLSIAILPLDDVPVSSHYLHV